MAPVLASMDVLWQGGRLISWAVRGLLADRYGIKGVYCGGLLLLVEAAAQVPAGGGAGAA